LHARTQALANSTGKKESSIKKDYEAEGDLGKVAVGARSTQRTMFQPKPLTIRGVHQVRCAVGRRARSPAAGGGRVHLTFYARTSCSKPPATRSVHPLRTLGRCFTSAYHSVRLDKQPPRHRVQGLRMWCRGNRHAAPINSLDACK